MQREHTPTGPLATVFTSTGHHCAATFTLGQAPRLGPGRLPHGRILVEEEKLSSTLPHVCAMDKGWSFHAGYDGSGLLARAGESTLLSVAPIALAPQTLGIFPAKNLEHWLDVVKAMPPCGFEKGWVFPWFEAFEPTPETVTWWNRWCLGWLLHHQDVHMGGDSLGTGLYVSVQAGHLESSGAVHGPRVQVQSGIARVDGTLVERATERLHAVTAERPITETLRQHAAPQRTPRLLGSSQYEPIPTSIHGRMELVWEALHGEPTASISRADTKTG